MPGPGAASRESAGNGSWEEGFQIYLINLPQLSSTWCCPGNRTNIRAVERMTNNTKAHTLGRYGSKGFEG